MRETPGNALEICKHAVAPFLVQLGERSSEEMIIGHRTLSIRLGVPYPEPTLDASNNPLSLTGGNWGAWEAGRDVSRSLISTTGWRPPTSCRAACVPNYLVC